MNRPRVEQVLRAAMQSILDVDAQCRIVLVVAELDPAGADLMIVNNCDPGEANILAAGIDHAVDRQPEMFVGRKMSS